MAEPREECKGRILLKAWLKDNGKSQAWLAKLLDLSPPSVFAWLDGTSRPMTHHREMLEAITGISRYAWEFSREREQREAALARMEGVVDCS